MGLTVKPLDIFAVMWDLENTSVEKKTTAPKQVYFIITKSYPKIIIEFI